LTWGVAKQRVSSVIGAAADTSMQKLAGYALEEAIAHWDSWRDWKFALKTQAGVVLPAGTAGFAVPTDYKKTYNIRVITPLPRVLSPSSKRERDIYNPNQSVGGTPMAYHAMSAWDNQGTSSDAPGNITVFPTPDSEVTLDHTYYRRMSVPSDITNGLTTSDSSIIDFPRRFQTTLLALAKMYFLGDRGSDENLQFWTQLAMDGLQRARAEDEWTPDEDSSIVPGVVAYRRPYDPNDITPFLGDW
jgi:hypothetical protein